MTTIALKETAQGWLPCHLSEIKKGETFYIVEDGLRGPIQIATDDAVQNPHAPSGWFIPNKEIS